MNKIKASTIRLSVSLDENGVKSYPEVLAGVKKAGMRVEQQLKNIGVLSGSINEDKLPALHKVVGVGSVEAERPVQIAPPTSPVQ